ncbi:DUF2809 domain-containing protein [Microbacterium yannicii]|uniref:ribosomal maturation YjgA family protein n=1 Tax=Microbacterium yannicii TaxID=671622 RepID=UPI0003112DC3|nr:DUF2809 domain-containing protein [Microbacterium yannicii]
MTASEARGPRHPFTGRRRIAAVVALAAVIGSGLAVHSLLPDTAATDIAGDALYAAAVSLALAFVAPRWRAMAVAGFAAAWCVAVELFQLTGIPLVLGAQFPPAMLVLGTVFDGRDLVIYLTVIALLAVVDVATAHRLGAHHDGVNHEMTASACCNRDPRRR